MLIPVPLSPSSLRIVRLCSIFPSTNPVSLPSSLHQIAHHLLAVQAQEPDAALLSFWLRVPPPRPTRAVLLSLLLEGKSKADIVRIWANRVTLQCVCKEDVDALSSAVGGNVDRIRRNAVRRQVGEVGVDILDNVVDKVRACLRQGQEVNSKEVDVFIEDEIEKVRKGKGGPKAFDKALVAETKRCIRYSVFVMVTVEGSAERVLRSGYGGRIVVVELNRGEGVDVDTGILKCAQRYFNGYGPCLETDFRYWMGIGAKYSKKAVGKLIELGDLEEVETEEGKMLMVKGRLQEMKVKLEGVERVEGVRFVGKFEPALLAHKDKGWLVGERERKRVWSQSAQVMACVLVDGRIRGVWKKEGDDMKIRLFADGQRKLRVAEIKDMFRTGGEILRGFYQNKGFVIIEREKEDGQVELLRGEMGKEEDEDVGDEADGNGDKSGRRLRKRRKR